MKAKHPQLIYEVKLYKQLSDGIGMPKVHYCGVEGDFNVLVMDHLGASLEEVFNSCD